MLDFVFAFFNTYFIVLYCNLLLYLLMYIFHIFQELVDLKHSLSKQKKMFVDQSAELAHLIRRGEQYEGEVKRLRGRVEELKRELATTEEDYDTVSNTIK